MKKVEFIVLFHGTVGTDIVWEMGRSVMMDNMNHIVSYIRKRIRKYDKNKIDN